MSKIIVVSTTCDDQEVLNRISHHLIENRLAACCQIQGPIQSIYRWQGKVTASEEWVCSIKTMESCFAEVEQAIQKFHSYDVPEIMAVSVETGSSAYIDWIESESG